MRRRKGSKVPPKSILQIRNEANHVRTVLGLNQRKINMIPLLEFILPKFLPSFVYEIVPREYMGVDEARTYPDKHAIYIREDVYLAATNEDRRAQFTLAHELGHLVMHGNLGKSSSYARNSLGHQVFEDSEWQADTFASEFLMPYTEAKMCINSTEIYEKFGVSKSAAETRYSKIH